MTASGDRRLIDQPLRTIVRRRWVRRVVGTYAGISALWILTSDLAVDVAVPTSADTAVSMIKGWAFVSATAVMLGIWLTRYARAIDASSDEITALHDRTKRDEQRWVLALETSGQGVWDWDAVTNIGFRSPSWSTMLGYRDGDIPANPDGWLDLVHPDDLRLVLDAAAETATPGHDHAATEHRMRRSDGTYCWVADRSTVIERSADGRPKRVLGVQIDISHQRETIAELDAHRVRLADLVIERTLELEFANRSLMAQMEEVADLYNNAPCGYHSLGPDAKVMAMNDTELRWLGYERDEVVGRIEMQQLLTPESRARFEDAFPRFIAGGTITDVDLDFVRQDGTVFPVVLSTTAIRDSSGRFIRSRSTVFDNRERRVRERQVALLNAELAKRAEDAEQASRAKSNFLATMSHEMRTPLNAIVGFSHVLEREVTDPSVKDRLRKVHAAAGHLTEIINDVLDLSKIESGKLTLEAVAFNPAKIIDDAVALVAGQAESRSIAVSTLIDDAIPNGVRGDPTRFEQAVLNYLSNAVKFTDGPSVQVRLTRLSDDTEHVVLRVEVIDEGPGIAPDDLRRLFNRFEQGDASTTRRHGGTGLGLVITRQLAHAMGGDAGALSTPGVGSTFWFDAQFATDAAATTSEADDVPAAEIDEMGWDARVLVVEDNELNQEVACELLAQLGVTAHIASSGAEALRMTDPTGPDDTAYDLVLMDIQMPGMDGFETTRLLRQRPLYTSVPIVAMTAGVFTSDREGASNAGMDDHLTKPIDPRQLSRFLHRWLPVATRRSADARRGSIDAGPGNNHLDPIAERVLDVATGLTYCSGLHEVYVSRLTRWVDENLPLAEQLRSVRTHDDARLVSNLVHLLVSSAGYLGAREVSDAACRFEAQINGATLGAIDEIIAADALALADSIVSTAVRARELFPDVARALDHVPASHEVEDSSDRAVAATSVVIDAVVARRDELQELLRADDAIASRYLDANFRELAGAFASDPTAFAQFVTQVHHFDFTGALQTMERARLERSDDRARRLGLDQSVMSPDAPGLASTNVLSPPANVRTSDQPD